ncbi:MAG: tetratricopeptide repeat protein [Alphaproteobacteria bacterium]|nr:tetratricopeptide repeat protein [Alphaproteobacteria bacterium]MBO4644181.1 tetratricopeptide repeat protein [Alphaproteobacteria bacterium]
MNQSYILTQEIIENYRIICQKESQDIENWLILGRCLVDVQRYDEAQEALTKIFEEGRFFSFKNGVPRLRLSSLMHWRKNRLLFAKAYADLAMISLNQGNLAEAERQLTMALSVFEKEEEDFEYARAANRLGMVYRLAGAFESAEEAHYRAKNLAEKHQWSALLAETFGNLGMVYEGKDRFELALEQHNEALRLLEHDEKHSYDAACLQRQVGLCCLRKGDFKRALDALQAGFQSFGRQNELSMQSRLLNDMTLVYQSMGDDEKALETAFLSVQKAVESGDDFEMAANRLLYGGLRVEQNNTDEETEQYLTTALVFFKEKNKKAENANTAAMLGLLYLRRGDWDRAESFFKDSMRIEEMLHRSLGLASDYSNLGLIAQKKGQKQKAAEYWYKASLYFESSGDRTSAEYFKKQAKLMWEAAGVLLRPE